MIALRRSTRHDAPDVPCRTLRTMFRPKYRDGYQVASFKEGDVDGEAFRYAPVSKVTESPAAISLRARKEPPWWPVISIMPRSRHAFPAIRRAPVSRPIRRLHRIRGRRRGWSRPAIRLLAG